MGQWMSLGGSWVGHLIMCMYGSKGGDFQECLSLDSTLKKKPNSNSWSKRLDSQSVCGKPSMVYHTEGKFKQGSQEQHTGHTSPYYPAP